MNCSGFSSTGLQNINANEISLDNTTIFSNSNVCGFTNFKKFMVFGNNTSLSTLNVSGLKKITNKTTVLTSLNPSD
jgi:hypothetical protein